MKNATLLLLLFSIVVLGTNCIAKPTTADAKAIDHTTWDRLLKKYVNDKGFVDYAGFKKDEAALGSYLEVLSKNAPNPKTWSTNEQLAYWINAYNAYTIQLILNHYPVASIKDIGSTIKIPFVSTGWDIKFIRIGGKKLDLNNIEHGIIRKQFSEARIHFALVCAAKSCPKLRNEAYTSERLNTQLDDQARDFLNDSNKNNITTTKASLSKILSWYSGDFTKSMPITDWLNKYAKTKVTDKTTIDYLDYNWELNGK
jgi:Protein of unknown function, DUF547